MASFSVDLKEVKQWLNSTSDRDHASKTFLRRAGVIAENIVKDEAHKNSVTGISHNSIQMRLYNTSVEVMGNESLISSLETGSPPGTKVSVKALERWAMRRLGSRGAAYGVAKNIEKKGTRKYRNRGPKQLTSANKEIERSITKLLPKLSEEFTK